MDTMTRLTSHQLALLRAAAARIDGTVLTRGFSWGPHHHATASSLVRMGLVVFLKGGRGYSVWKVTPAGKAACV